MQSRNPTSVVLGVLFTLLLVIGYLIWEGTSKEPTSSPVPQVISPSRLVCTIERSDEREEVGKNIVLSNLNTDQPRALFPSGVNSPMTKISDTPDILVIQIVASGSGSVDTITVYKSTGKYEREARGSFLGDYSHSDSGQCR